MSTTLKRTSMALDTETLESLELLSKSWNVSKAEVMRRSIVLAKDNEETKKQRRLDALAWLNQNGISKKQAEAYKAELKAEREAWPDRWEEYEASRH